MITVCKKDLCSGCGACHDACLFNAITMENSGSLGHVYPKINQKLCKDCGKCAKVCPNNVIPPKNKAFSVYAAWNINSHSRNTSSSGGIADAFYNEFLKKNALIVGVKFTQECRAELCISDCFDDILSFKGSKYVQATTDGLYTKILVMLELGKIILFIGTPCQCAALQNFIPEKRKSNLFIIDIICHGVPSYRLLEDYIKTKNNQQQIDRVVFRDRDGYLFQTKKNEKVLYSQRCWNDEFITLYLRGYLCRDSCYQCPYANLDRMSDITIGDFWGLGREKKTDYTTQKVSCVLVNSPKGNKMLDMIRDKVFIEERELKEAVLGNPQLQYPTSPAPERDSFIKNYSIYGIKKALLKSVYFEVSKNRMKTKIRILLNCIRMKNKK